MKMRYYHRYVMSPEDIARREELQKKLDEWFSLHPITQEQKDSILRDCCIALSREESSPENH